MMILGWTSSQWAEAMGWFEDSGGIIPDIKLCNPLELMCLLQTEWRYAWNINPGEHKIALLSTPWKHPFRQHTLASELFYEASMKASFSRLAA